MNELLGIRIVIMNLILNMLEGFSE